MVDARIFTVKPVHWLYLLAIALMALMPNGAFAENNPDPCNDLLNVDLSNRQHLKKIGDYSRRHWAAARADASATSSPENGSGDLMFTTFADFSVMPDCRRNRRRVNALYYPIGLVVRPLKKIKLGQKVFQLVEADHGLRMFIRPEHLRKIEPEKTYFFSNSIDINKIYCTKKKDCEITTEAKQEALVSNMTGKGHHLWPKTRYAVASGPIGECESSPYRVEIKTLLPGGRWDSSGGYINPCILGPDDNWYNDGSVKIVTLEKYRKIFGVGLTGFYQRFPQSWMDKIKKKFTNIKKCNAKITVGDKVTFKVGAGVELEFYVLDLTASTAAERVKEVITTREDGDYSLYSVYAIAPAGTNDPEFQHLEAFSLCDERNRFPNKPYLFAIYNENFDLGVIIFASDDPSADFASKIKAKVKNMRGNLAGYRPVGKYQNLIKGQFWMVTGADEYFVLREVLAEEFGNFKEMDDVQTLDQDDPKYWLARERTIDFFTHLMISALSQFKVAR